LFTEEVHVTINRLGLSSNLGIQYMLSCAATNTKYHTYIVHPTQQANPKEVSGGAISLLEGEAVGRAKSD
jgi:hypothetical protein